MRILLLCLLLVGCSSEKVTVKTVPIKPTIPENLTEPCPPLNKLKANDGASTLKWGIDTVAKYNDCKLRHKKLVEALK